MTTKKNLALSRTNDAIDGHEYATKMKVDLTEKTKRKGPFSPLKDAPLAKRKDTGIEGKEEGMNVILEAIKQLTDKVDTLDTELQQNSVMLTSIARI